MFAFNYSDCAACGRKMDAIFFCIQCAERFCSQDCFGRHAIRHANASDRVLTNPPFQEMRDWERRPASQGREGRSRTLNV